MKASDSQSHRSTLVVESADRTQQQFLRFTIQPGLMALVELDRVMELVNMPIDRVVPMPHLPPAVRGVYNWRGEILWIVDLAMLLGADGASRRYRSLQPTIVIGSIIDRVGIAQLPAVGSRSQPQQPQKTIGLIVDEIVEIEWCQLDLIGSTVPADLDPALSKWVRGMWESPTGENFLVLDGQAILERADVHADV